MESIQFTPFNIPEYNAVPTSSPDFEKIMGFRAKELYEEVFRKTAEKFGKGSLAYVLTTNEISKENMTGSNFLWCNEVNIYLPKEKRVMTIKDMEGIIAENPLFFKGHYANTTQGILRTDESFYNKSELLVKNLATKLKTRKIKGAPIEYSPEKPLVISGLEIVQDKKNPDKGYGLLLNPTSKTTFETDTRFTHKSQNPRKQEFGGVEKTLWTREDGFAGVGAYVESVVLSYCDNLSFSYCDGWVVVVDAKGVAPKILSQYEQEFEKLRQNFEDSKISLISKIQNTKL